MNKFIILAAVATLVAGEAPAHVGLSGGYSDGSSYGSNGGSRGGNGGFRGGSGGGGGSGLNEYVDEALLARVGDLISRGGDGSGTQQGTEGLNLDSEILTRVSGSLGDGGSSGPSSGYGAPSRSGPSSLGRPEAAQRIAEFELSDSSSTGGQGGGYDAAPAPAPGPQYGAPLRGASRGSSGNFGSSSSSGQISLGRPMAAQRVDDFSLSGGSGSSRGGSSSSSGGY